jgi:phage tail-like protein
MSRSGNFDPIEKFRWRVYLLNETGQPWARGGFTSCSAPGVTLAINNYPEGGRHLTPRKIVDGASFKPITLRRGVISDPNTADFGQWMNDLYKALQPKNQIYSIVGNQYRKTIVIEQLNKSSEVIVRWTMYGCIPTNYEPASDFEATGENEVSIESLTFEYEGFDEERTNKLFDTVKKFAKIITG